MQPGYRLALALSTIAILFAYKAITIAPLSPLPIMLGYALEAVVLFGLFLLSELVERATRAPGVVVPARILYYSIVHLLVVCILAHTFFFESAAERRFSLLEIDLRTLGYFFRSVLPPRGYVVLGSLLALLHVLAFTLTRVLAPMRAHRVALVWAAAFFCVSIGLGIQRRVPSSLADMGASIWERLTTESIAVDRTRPARLDPRVLDKSAPLTLPDVTAYDRVLVFVMETMTAEAFEREAKLLSPATFVHGARPNVHAYTRYYATNQDSRTGMLAMLGSRLIPYEAYTEDGRDGYMFLSQLSSLVSLFKRGGFRTAFAVSQVEMELVVTDLPWDDRLHLEEPAIERLRKDHLCFVPYEFEHSCEDRALLPDVLRYIDQHPRLFLYQEFIWGHASEYNEASGKTNTEYYSAYLDAVIRHLHQTSRLERTLIVVTSDHGFRDKGLQTERAVYHIPLWFYNPRFESRLEPSLYSHLDFKDLLLHELHSQHSPPAEAPFVMVVGPTGTSFVAVLTRADQFLLMKARKNERHLLHAEGEFGDGDPTASDFMRLFEDYRAYFAHLRP